MRSLLFASISLASFAACSPYDPDLGPTPFLCGAEEPRCPDGHTCQDDGTGRMVCFAPGGTLVDAQVSGFQCADDSLLEGAGKNDTIGTAYATPVAAQRKDISFAGLSICPEGDKDVYMITTTAPNQNVTAVTTWESGMPVSVFILGSGGATIGNGAMMGEKSMRAYVANLPMGTYYVRAEAAATVKNNYRIQITVDP